MADLQLTADFSQIIQADKAAKDLETSFREITRAISRGAASQNQLLQVFNRLEASGMSLSEVYRSINRDMAENQKTAARLENEYRKQSLANKSAAESARVFEQALKEQERTQKEVAASTRRYEAELESLKREYNPLYVAMSTYEKAQKRIERAHELGIISTRRYRQELDQLQAEYQQYVAGAAGATNRFNQTLNSNARSMSRSAVLTQQAGYQIGDFIVQWQSGTNVLVAFGQQATQVAGTLTLLGGSWVMMGTVLGIIIPLVTALGAAWMRTNGQGRTLEQTVTDLTSATDAFRDSLDNVMSQDLETTFGNFTDAVRSLEEGFVDLNSAAALRNFNETLARMESAASGGFFGRALDLVNPFSIPSRQDLTEGGTGWGADIRAFESLGFDMARTAYLGYTEELQRLAAQGDMEGVLDEFNRFFEDATDGTDDVTNAGYLLMLQMRQALLAVAEMSAEMNGTAEAARQAAAAAEALAEAEEEAARVAERLAAQAQREAERRQRTLADLRDELIIRQDILRYGEDSLQVATLRAMQEGIAAGFRDQELQDYIDLTLQLREAGIQANYMAMGLDESAVSALELAGIDITSGISNAAAAAARLAGSLGISLNAAISLQNRNAAISSGTWTPGALGAGRGTPSVGDNQGSNITGFSSPEAFLNSFNSPRGSGGGSSENFVERLQREMALRQRILGLTSDQSDLEREIDRITQGLGAARSQYSEEFIANLARQNLALQEQERIAESLAQTQENLANKISSTFGEAMMSIAEGTKSTEEAFRDMARAIISELYRVLVVQQIVNQVQSAIGGSSGFGSFLGSMLGGGRASGGSVMAGQAYLVGERGPEVIVPGRSGTVMNSNLTQKAMGGQQEVSVRVFVDETGNFDAKVEQISARTVQRAAPQIVEASKKSMIEGVQRGGSIARVFR